jgi:hypothetical protein
LRRDEEALPSRSISARLTVFETNALGHDLVHRLHQIRSNPQLRGLGRYVAAFDQAGVSLDDFKRRLLALDPEPDVKFMLADAKIAAPSNPATKPEATGRHRAYREGHPGEIPTGPEPA